MKTIGFDQRLYILPFDLDRLKGDKKAYDLKLRPQLMVQTIQQLQEAGVEPDVW
jgi:hypothetical protein